MSAQPNLIPEPWANQGARIAIPDMTAEAGRASWAAGFPPETSLPLGAGGVPPHWLDFQGVLYALSAHVVFAQTGARYLWQAALDYPVGACIIGSNNTVYQAIQESGPNYAAGAKDPTAAANSGYWQPMVPPDGVTIKVINGKMVAQGTSAASLADNVTIVDNNDKLSVNLSNSTPAALRNISQYLAKSGGGLMMDDQTGKLYVSVANGALIPLTENLDVYVNGATGDDTIEDGRGTEEKPFQTIQACVDYVTQTYFLGPYNISINIAGGTYSENVLLPNYMTTSGRITLQPSSGSPTITNPADAYNALTCLAGRWALRQINIAGAFPDLSFGIPIRSAIAVVGNTADLTISGGNLSCVFSGTLYQDSIAVIYAQDGALFAIISTQDNPVTLQATKGFAMECNVVAMNKNSCALIGGRISCSGDMTAFCRMWTGALLVVSAETTFAGAMRGKSYEISTGAGVQGAAEALPGDAPGTANTYGWYVGG